MANLCLGVGTQNLQVLNLWNPKLALFLIRKVLEGESEHGEGHRAGYLALWVVEKVFDGPVHNAKLRQKSLILQLQGPDKFQ